MSAAHPTGRQLGPWLRLESAPAPLPCALLVQASPGTSHDHHDSAARHQSLTLLVCCAVVGQPVSATSPPLLLNQVVCVISVACAGYSIALAVVGQGLRADVRWRTPCTWPAMLKLPLLLRAHRDLSGIGMIDGIVVGAHVCRCGGAWLPPPIHACVSGCGLQHGIIGWMWRGVVPLPPVLVSAGGSALLTTWNYWQVRVVMWRGVVPLPPMTHVCEWVRVAAPCLQHGIIGKCVW